LLLPLTTRMSLVVGTPTCRLSGDYANAFCDTQ
jgi:hypothetical protein